MSRDDQISLGLGVAVMGALAFVVLTMCGCGSAQQQHRALNALAATADPSYELAVSGCDEAEGVVIARAGTTYEQDRDAIAAIRSVCDRVFGAFETLRLAHRAARAAVDGGAGALLDESMRSLADAWAAAQRLLPELAGLAPR